MDGRSVRVTVQGMSEGDGPPRHAVCVLTDVTKQRSAELRVQQVQRLEVAGQLAGGIAHEINNMMTVILGLTEFLARDDGLPAAHQRDLAGVRKAADRAADMARQLLAFSRRQVLQPRLVDVNTAIAGMSRLLRQLMGADREVTLTLSPDAGSVFADDAQLEQAVLNLALNARDAMPSGGHFTITSALARLDAKFAARYPDVDVRSGDYAHIALIDDGEGMTPDTLDRVFEPFFTTKPVGQGTGLGLATVYGIVKQSNGYVWADSAPGKGTTFHLYLPQAAGAHRRRRAAGAEGASHSRQRHHHGGGRRADGAGAGPTRPGSLRLYRAGGRGWAGSAAGAGDRGGCEGRPGAGGPGDARDGRPGARAPACTSRIRACRCSSCRRTRATSWPGAGCCRPGSGFCRSRSPRTSWSPRCSTACTPRDEPSGGAPWDDGAPPRAARRSPPRLAAGPGGRRPERASC